ncbi:MAG TPA: tetratricopeptide repeat protein [Pirellulales bacterium]|jgi:tetratricopeptide (TPR) repeat protein
MERADDLPDLSPDEERVIGHLVEYQQALADGTPTTDETHEATDVAAEFKDQLVRGKHLLELMATIGQERDDPIELSGYPADAAGPTTAARLEDLLSTLQHQGKTPQRLGRFIIQRELGIGGHGVVLLAFDSVLKRQVALKIPRGEALVSSNLRRRFAREAQAAARLTHPNLVSVYEVGEVGSIGYIASAFCTGPSLATWLQQRREPLSPIQAAHLVAPLADAMQYAHSQGVLHRDIKPSNVLLEPEAGCVAGAPGTLADLPFVPKLADFGLAKLEGTAGTDTLTGVALGTPGYMAPEQVEGRMADIGPATDVYGLGALLYEAVTGKRPFVGTSDAECMQRILSEDPPPPSHWRSSINVDMDAICLKCLEKSPGRRYASAQALADDLRRYLAGEPIHARCVTRVERLVRWARRNPRIAALTAMVLILLTSIAAISTVAAVRIDRARHREQEATAEAQREAQRVEEFALRAQSESDTARGVANFLEGMFRSADPIGLEGVRFQSQVTHATELSAADILRQGTESLRTDLKDQPAVQAKLMAVIGSVYVTMGKLREAQPLLERSLRIREELTGPDSLETAESLHDLATLRFANFDFSATRNLLERALAIRLRRLGADDPDTIRTKFNLAWLAVTSGHSTTAEKQAALPLMEEVLQFHRRENVSPTRYGFALIGLAMLRYEVEAKPMHAAALLAEANQVLTENGGSDIGAGLLLMLRSYVQCRVGSGRVAVATIEAGIERIRKAAGDRHPVLIWPRYMWADALISTGRYDEALAVHRDTIDLCRQIYNDRHRAVGLTKVRMAEPLLLIDDRAEAEATLREALDIFRYENSNLSNREYTLQDLLTLLQTDKRFADAAQLCREELAGARRIPPGEESNAYLTSLLEKTALAEEMSGNWNAAQSALTEAISRKSVVASPADPAIAEMWLDAARVALAQGLQEDYRAICQRLVKDFAPDASPELLRAIVWTCVITPDTASGSYDFVGLAQRALEGNSKKITFQRMLAIALLRAGHYQQAKTLYEELFETPGWTARCADFAVVSMAHSHLGDMAAAQAWLEKAEAEPVPTFDDSSPWRATQRELLERDLLVDEARQLLKQATMKE